MQIFKNLAVVISISIILLSCVNISAKKREIIYQDKNGGRLDVFNIKDSLVSHEDSEYLKRRNYKYGDLGGNVKFCSDSEYYCLHGGLDIVIPRNPISKQDWALLDINCHSEEPYTGQEKIVITCLRNKFSTTFVYSRDKGVISYVFSWDKDREYFLVDNKGLFAWDEKNN